MKHSKSYAKSKSPILFRYPNLLIIFRFGKIVSTKAMIDQKTGLCKGYGFAMYEKEEDCEKAINELNKKGLQASFARVGQVLGHLL